MSDSFHSNVHRLAVAPRAPGLLVVRLYALGHVVVDHIANVRFVDAHAERVRRNDERHRVGDEITLRALANIRRHAAVVCRGDGSVFHLGALCLA